MRDREHISSKRAKKLRVTMTKAEVILWSAIRKSQLHRYKFRRQVPIGPYIADFASPLWKFVIEVDGATHATDAEIKHDERRTRFLVSEGWTIYRVSNLDIYQNLDGVLYGIATEFGLRAGEVTGRRSRIPEPETAYMGGVEA